MIYIISGSFYSISYVSSSISAKEIARSINEVLPDGSNGIVIGNDGNDWTIGGGHAVDIGVRRGETFSMLNLRSKIEIDPLASGEIVNPSLYDFAITFVGFDNNRIPIYKYTNIKNEGVVLGTSKISERPVLKILADTNIWPKWYWSQGIKYSKNGILLHPGINGFYPISRNDLENRILVYRARTTNSKLSKMRLQINWQDENNKYISSFIKIVEVNADWNYYFSDYLIPTNARIGNVYVQLADDNQEEIEISGIDIR
jgi:hypothetical protein